MERLAVRRTLELDCTADELWRLVSTPDELAAWLGRDVELDVRVGGSGRLTDDDGDIRRVAIREVVDGERLAFSWWPEDDERAVSEVVFAVEGTGHGSRLHITETAAGAAQASVATSWDIRIISLWLAVCTRATSSAQHG